MKHHIKKLLRESLISEDEDKIINLLNTGDEINIELAFGLADGQGIDINELVKSIYGDLLLNKADGETIKDKVLYLTNLEKLDLSYNNLTSLKGIEKLTNLKRLSLHNNNLTSLEGIENLTNLKRLDLSDNDLTNLKGIEKLTKLKALWLYNNKLTSLKGIGNLTNLEWLDLKGKMNLISDAEKERITALLPDTEIEF